MIGFVTATNGAEMKAFYTDKLGFRFVADDGFALVFDAHGTMIRAAKMSKFTPQPFTVLGWEVNDIVRTVKELYSKGVKFEKFRGMPQDDDGIWTAPTGDKVAWFKDPSGNILSLSQHQ